jgi:hypothetical protein
LPELAETMGPHPAMLARLQRKLASGGHLLPFFGREKAILANIRIEVRRRVTLN